MGTRSRINAGRMKLRKKRCKGKVMTEMLQMVQLRVGEEIGVNINGQVTIQKIWRREENGERQKALRKSRRKDIATSGITEDADIVKRSAVIYTRNRHTVQEEINVRWSYVCIITQKK